MANYCSRIIGVALTIVITGNVGNANASNKNTKSRLDKIAIMRCAEIEATKKIDGAARVRIVNDYRLDADLDPFIEGDEYLVRVTRLGLCESLIKEDPLLSEKLLEREERQRGIERTARQERKKLKRQANINEGVRVSRKLERTVRHCDLAYRDYAIKLKNNGHTVSLELWGKFGQGLREATCSVTFQGKGFHYLVKVADIDQPVKLKRAMFTTRRAPFGTAFSSSYKVVNNLKKKKQIEYIKVVIDGFVDSNRSAIWPEGKVFTQTIYGKDDADVS